MPNGGLSRRSFIGAAGSLVITFALPQPLRGRRPLRPGASFVPPPATALDSWLAIGRDESITICCGKVELGTGASTALAQIVAEELDLDPAGLRWVQGDSAKTVDQGPTVGSQSVKRAGPQLRLAAAEARLVLMTLAAERLGVPASELTTANGVVTASSDPSKRATFGELIGDRRFDRTIGENPPVKPVSAYTRVGTSVPRIELPAKVTGRHQYVHDVRVPGMVHGRVLRPSSIGAKPLAVDDSLARKIPGFIRVVRKGSFVGVVAEREEQAVRAVDALRVTWSRSSMLPVEGELYRELRRLPSREREVASAGDVSATLGGGTTVRAAYEWPFQLHASLGPSCGVADVTPERATIWSATQGTHRLVTPMAALLGLPPEAVRVIWAEGAGCYGHNGADDVAADAALLSQAVGRPVRVQWTRRDENGWEPEGPAMVVELAGSVGRDGRIAAWRSDLWSVTHGSRPNGPVAATLLAGALAEGPPPPPAEPSRGGERNARTTYRLPNERVVAHHLGPFPIRTSSLRGLGSLPNSFANESFMDELAHAAGVDPVEFRLRHLDDPRARAVVEAAAKRAQWTPAPPGRRPTPAGETASGRGFGYVQYDRTEAYVAAVVDVLVNRRTGRIRVTRVTVAHDCGLIVNPNGLENQIEGNVIQAISRTLKEAVRFDRGRVTSLDWTGYPILTFAEVPDAIDIVLIDRPDQPSIGGGEPAGSPIPGAIGNAIFDATGVRLREVPFTPSRWREAVPAKAAATSSD